MKPGNIPKNCSLVGIGEHWALSFFRDHGMVQAGSQSPQVLG